MGQLEIKGNIRKYDILTNSKLEQYEDCEKLLSENEKQKFDEYRKILKYLEPDYLNIEKERIVPQINYYNDKINDFKNKIKLYFLKLRLNTRKNINLKVLKKSKKKLKIFFFKNFKKLKYTVF